MGGADFHSMITCSTKHQQLPTRAAVFYTLNLFVVGASSGRKKCDLGDVITIFDQTSQYNV